MEVLSDVIVEQCMDSIAYTVDRSRQRKARYPGIDDSSNRKHCLELAMIER
jgi:hypothetical protein